MIKRSALFRALLFFFDLSYLGIVILPLLSMRCYDRKGKLNTKYITGKKSTNGSYNFV